ncbi:TRAP transporter substrate-binding protein DctP [Orrella sp. 11846]|uniref:TRAP transporter substrate-binding protein n=1 Tax=Orrella sp. 11846 TaxID=3409913 RepID=UPI003B5C687C
MKKQVLRTLTASLATAFTLGAGLSVAHAKPVTLRVADILPNGSFIYNLSTKPFMDEVEKRTNGEVTFKYFPGQQLGKAADMLKLTQSGVTDIGYVGPSYLKDKMPLSAVLELPGAFSNNSCEGFVALWNMTHDGGFLQKQEWDAQGVIPVLVLMTRHHIFVSKDKDINTMADLEGLKMRSAGGAMARTQSEMGMVPVDLSAPETYESMSRGTVDGTFWPAQSLFDYGLDDLVKTGSNKDHVAGIVLTYSISKKAWDKLTPEQQKVIMEVGKEVSSTSCKNFDETEQNALKRIQDKGVKTLAFSDEDQKKMYEAYDRSAQAWAKSLDDRGRPGSEALKAMREAVEQAKKEIQ